MGGMNTLAIVIEATGWLAFAMMFAVYCIIHYAWKKIRAERRKRLPIRDLIHRI